MIEQLKELFHLKRDNNYYGGLILLQVGIVTIFYYLFFDAFEPIAFLITFILCGWGFTLLWKSDNDYRFNQLQLKVTEMQIEARQTTDLLETLRHPAPQPSPHLRKLKLTRGGCGPLHKRKA